MSVATPAPALPATAAAIAAQARELLALAERFQREPTRASLDQVLAAARGVTLAGLRGHHQLGSDGPPPRAPSGRRAA